MSYPPITEWPVKRGVLFLFLQMPAIALIAGYTGLTTLPIATFGVFVSFTAFTVWVSYRKTVSYDPAEPVHHLHRYALYALLPYVVVSVVLIPAFFAADIVYWQLWYDFGTQLTGEPATQLWSLVAGMVMYTLAGMGLAMGYYVLFERHSLLNAVLFLGVTVPALFLYLFPVFSLAGAQPGPAWYIAHWLALGAMAVTAWAVPRFWTRAWPQLRGRARPAVLIAFALLLAAPYAFAVERAVNWQSDEQRRIDQAAFDRVTVQPRGPLVFAGVDNQTARYDFTLSFGPRSFVNAAGANRAVDAGPVAVEGRLTAAGTTGTTVAWCTGHVRKLVSPNAVRDPTTFPAVAQRLDHVDVAVSCAGPATAVDELCPAQDVTAHWVAGASLSGERTTQRRQFTGQTQATLKFPAGPACR